MVSRITHFTVNGKRVQVDVEPRTSLADALRYDLKLTGTHVGCEHGVCGACTVIVDGAAVRSCLMLAAQAEGTHVVTIEGLPGEPGHPVQTAWKEKEVPQCGYCQSGQIMTTVALLESFRHDGRKLLKDDIDAALAGNLCRCGTYPRIREGLQAAARNMGIEVEA